MASLRRGAEAESGYFGKERDIDIITKTMHVPLQRAKTFGKNNYTLQDILKFLEKVEFYYWRGV